MSYFESMFFINVLPFKLVLL